MASSLSSSNSSPSLRPLSTNERKVSVMTLLMTKTIFTFVRLEPTTSNQSSPYSLSGSTVITPCLTQNISQNMLSPYLISNSSIISYLFDYLLLILSDVQLELYRNRSRSHGQSMRSNAQSMHSNAQSMHSNAQSMRSPLVHYLNLCIYLVVPYLDLGNSPG
jgi:hypothetical protein